MNLFCTFARMFSGDQYNDFPCHHIRLCSFQGAAFLRKYISSANERKGYFRLKKEVGTPPPFYTQDLQDFLFRFGCDQM